MCGIAGALGFADAFAVDAGIVRRMSDTLRHRGPDDSGVLYEAEWRVGLGHRRLSIVDLSPAGRQPMSNEDGTVWITYNGEIYNHAALREELEAKGHRFRSNTDTEAIVHLFEEEGARCVERLQGMFALAIWDGVRRKLFLARDRVGVKPLYYSQTPQGLLFGSEIKALVAHPSFTADLDEESLYHYLTFAFVPTPRTMFRGVNKLAPAERMTISADGGVERDIYWRPLHAETTARVAEMSDVEMEETLLGLLRGSVGKRMMSDVPFGVFLSGGVDSSTNVALMSELVSGPVRTFSTAPRGHAKYDELAPARIVAEHFNTEHHEVMIDESDLDAFLPELLDKQDEPLADWTCVPQHFVSRLARDSGTPVVQVGEGADEIFHGYKGYADHRRYFVPFQRYLPGAARRTAAFGATAATRRLGRGMRHAEALTDAAHSPIPYWGGSICFRGKLKDEVLGDRLRGHGNSLALAEALWNQAEEDGAEPDLFQSMTYVELKQRLPELLLQRLDRVAMMSSVEGREPFLDHELVEFVIALPPRMKYSEGTGKYILRRAVRGIVPDEILKRPKQGFGTPMVEWLRGPFGRRAQQTVTNSSLLDSGALNAVPLNRLFEEHFAGRADWSYQLWNAYTACTWHDRWVAGRRG